LHLLELPVCVPVNDLPPEGHGSEVRRHLADFPPAAEAVEEHARGVFTHAAFSVPSQHEEVSDVPDAELSGQMAATVNDGESRQFSVRTDEEGVSVICGPAAVKSVVPEPSVLLQVPLFEVGEIVQIELDQVRKDRSISFGCRHESDLHAIVSCTGFVVYPCAIVPDYLHFRPTQPDAAPGMTISLRSNPNTHLGASRADTPDACD